MTPYTNTITKLPKNKTTNNISKTIIIYKINIINDSYPTISNPSDLNPNQK